MKYSTLKVIEEVLTKEKELRKMDLDNGRRKIKAIEEGTEEADGEKLKSLRERDKKRLENYIYARDALKDFLEHDWR